MKTLALAVFLYVMISCTLGAAEATVTLDVWPGKPPGFQVEGGPEKDTSTAGKDEVAGRAVIRLGFVSKPQIVVYAPPKDKANGTAVVICPGGGFNILAWDLEGTEVAEWLNSIGVTAAVLKYRVPTAVLKDKKWEPPVQDAQRALSLVRSKAAEWGVNPERVGTLGFSAGGTTAGMTATKNGSRMYDAQDDVDKQPCHANFAILVYPYMLWDDKKNALGESVVVSEKTPPMFFAHAANDRVSPENSIQMFLALKKANVKGSELHIYESGGHGFGTRDAGNACTTWTKRCEEWLRARGLLTNKTVQADPDPRNFERGLYTRLPYEGTTEVETYYFEEHRVSVSGIDPCGADKKKRRYFQGTFEINVAKYDPNEALNARNNRVAWEMTLNWGNGRVEGMSVYSVDRKLVSLGMPQIHKADAFPNDHRLEGTFKGLAVTREDSIPTTLELKKDGHYSYSSPSPESGTYTLSGNTMTFLSSTGAKSTHTVIPYHVYKPSMAVDDQILIFDLLILRESKPQHPSGFQPGFYTRIPYPGAGNVETFYFQADRVARNPRKSVPVDFYESERVDPKQTGTYEIREAGDDPAKNYKWQLNFHWSDGRGEMASLGFRDGELAHLGLPEIAKAGSYAVDQKTDATYWGVKDNAPGGIVTTLVLYGDRTYSLSGDHTEKGKYMLSKNMLYLTHDGGSNSHVVIPFTYNDRDHPDRAAEEVMIFDNQVLRKKK